MFSEKCVVRFFDRLPFNYISVGNEMAQFKVAIRGYVYTSYTCVDEYKYVGR
jgi:hypothetical protein